MPRPRSRALKQSATGLLVPALLCASIRTAGAQTSGYEFTSTSGTYVEISGGTVLGTSSNDDEVFSDDTAGDFPPGTGDGFPIGFDFTLGATTYDRFAVSSNGWIVLGAGSVQIGEASANNFTPLSTPGAGFQTAVAAVGADLSGREDSELSYLTSGEAGSRVLTVQWKNYRKYGTAGDSYSFQIRLLEMGNKIEIVYGTMTSDLDPRNVQVGFRDGTSDCLTNRTTEADWSASTVGSDNTASMTLSDTVFPASGLTFSWQASAP